MPQLSYQPMEYIPVRKPVNRIEYVEEACRGKRVLDLGCWDETALSKKETPFWLHGRIAKVAHSVIGIDNSESLPLDGVYLGSSRILKGDITDKYLLAKHDIDIIVAGELIEHLQDTLTFLLMLKDIFPDKRLLCTTPNATTLSNFILGVFHRESMHKDHLNIYSYKTLSILCQRAKVRQYEIIPYHVKYTEMILRQKGLGKAFVHFAEKSVNLAELIFPLLSGGYVLDVTL